MESNWMAWALLALSMIWLSYALIGYPLLVVLIGVAAQRTGSGSAVGRVSVLVAVHNEACTIAARLRNILTTDHGPERLEIIVVSDASTDATDTICRDFVGRGVMLVCCERRGGKTAALDEAVKHASGEILVFTDATTRFRTDTLRRLVEPFGDPMVGCTSGRLAYATRRTDGAQAHDVFRRVEDFVRSREASLGYVPSLSGALHAMRRDLYQPVRSDNTRDLVDPAQVAARGFRVVFDNGCVADETGPTSVGQSVRARARVTLRGLTTLPTALGTLVASGCWRNAWQLVSHKLLRWLLWIPVLLAWLSHLAIARTQEAWPDAFVVHSALWATSGLAALLACHGVGGGSMSALGFPVLTLLPMAWASIAWCGGRRAPLWEPDRAQGES